MTELPFTGSALQSASGISEPLHAAGIDARIPGNDDPTTRGFCEAAPDEPEWGFELSRRRASEPGCAPIPVLASAGRAIADEPVRVELLDLRDLPAPEPLLRALAAVDAMQPGEMLEVITPLLPGPLLDVLAARGLAAGWRHLDGGSVVVTIHRGDAAARG